MRTIQLILVPIILTIIFIYVTRVKSRSLSRALVLAIGGLGASMIIFPGLTQAIANQVGVGRGTDLVLYVGLCGLSFINLLLFAKSRNLESQLSELVRKIAIYHADEPHLGGH